METKEKTVEYHLKIGFGSHVVAVKKYPANNDEDAYRIAEQMINSRQRNGFPYYIAELTAVEKRVIHRDNRMTTGFLGDD